MLPKKVYLEPPWNLHAFQHQMVAFPPAGYEFIVRETYEEKMQQAATRWNKARSLLKAANRVAPTTLAKAWQQKWHTPPAGTILTYAIDHLIFRPEPWVVEVEYATSLVVTRPVYLRRFKRPIERTLASPWCRKIICWSAAGSRSLLGDLDCRGFEPKIEVIRLAVPAKRFVKEYQNNRVRLLFVGSGITKGAFEGRGEEVFAVFTRLCTRYRNLELVVRSDVPPGIKARYRSMENIKILDKPVPREVLEREYMAADIFIMPSYGTVPFTLLEAMSYELPVVTIDSWANTDYVKDNQTGLVAEMPEGIPRHYTKTFQPYFLAPEFSRTVRLANSEVADRLAQKVSLLIEDPELRRRLGKAARWEVERGEFSLAKMNERLGKIFDEATTDIKKPVITGKSKEV